MSKVKFLRRELSLSQHELSAATGLPRWKIQLLENGLVAMELKELLALQAVLGESLSTEATTVCPNGKQGLK